MPYKDPAKERAHRIKYHKDYDYRPEVVARRTLLARARYNPGRQRENRIRSLYGLSNKEFFLILGAQGGTCAACGTFEWGPSGPLVDHDHDTGKVRGILCHSCNLAAGILLDSPKKAMDLARYLETHNAQ